MPTIREVVQTLSHRPGVDAVMLVSADGLIIDAQTGPIDADGLAAVVPGVVSAWTQLAGAAGRGEFGTTVVEFDRGMALVSGLTSDTMLAMLFQPDANIGDLLHELQQHRTAIASLL